MFKSKSFTLAWKSIMYTSLSRTVDSNSLVMRLTLTNKPTKMIALKSQNSVNSIAAKVINYLEGQAKCFRKPLELS